MTDTTAKTGWRTRDTQAIDALIEAVRGGSCPLRLLADVGFGMGNVGRSIASRHAFNGSMNDAFDLLSDLLPGWKWGRQWTGLMWVEKPATPPAINPRIYGEAETPARALLLATLKAWKETMK